MWAPLEEHGDAGIPEMLRRAGLVEQAETRRPTQRDEVLGQAEMAHERGKATIRGRLRNATREPADGGGQSGSEQAEPEPASQHEPEPGEQQPQQPVTLPEVSTSEVPAGAREVVAWIQAATGRADQAARAQAAWKVEASRRGGVRTTVGREIDRHLQ